MDKKIRLVLRKKDASKELAEVSRSQQNIIKNKQAVAQGTETTGGDANPNKAPKMRKRELNALSCCTCQHNRSGSVLCPDCQEKSDSQGSMVAPSGQDLNLAPCKPSSRAKRHKVHQKADPFSYISPENTQTGLVPLQLHLATHIVDKKRNQNAALKKSKKESGNIDKSTDSETDDNCPIVAMKGIRDRAFKSTKKQTFNRDRGDNTDSDDNVSTAPNSPFVSSEESKLTMEFASQSSNNVLLTANSADTSCSFENAAPELTFPFKNKLSEMHYYPRRLTGSVHEELKQQGTQMQVALYNATVSDTESSSESSCESDDEHKETCSLM